MHRIIHTSFLCKLKNFILCGMHAIFREQDNMFDTFPKVSKVLKELYFSALHWKLWMIYLFLPWGKEIKWTIQCLMCIELFLFCKIINVLWKIPTWCFYKGEIKLDNKWPNSSIYNQQYSAKVNIHPAFFKFPTYGANNRHCQKTP